METLRIGLVGTGGIGRTHIERINNTLQGGKVVACADPAGAFGLSVAEKYGIKGFENPIDMINDSEIDAVMCTTADPYHEEYVLASIAAGKYVFCEKPLAPKADACKRIVEAEMKAGKKLVQVGFMRRYDEGYKQLKAAVDSGKYGEALLLHCTHRNPSVPDDWDNSMAVENSMVHEIDVLRWLLGEDYATAEVRYGKSTNNGPKDLHDPQIMILTTKSGVRIDVESFVNNKNDYDIKCEIVCDGAVLNMPKPNYISVRQCTRIASSALQMHITQRSRPGSTLPRQATWTGRPHGMATAARLLRLQLPRHAKPRPSSRLYTTRCRISTRSNSIILYHFSIFT